MNKITLWTILLHLLKLKKKNPLKSLLIYNSKVHISKTKLKAGIVLIKIGIPVKRFVLDNSSSHYITRINNEPLQVKKMRQVRWPRLSMQLLMLHSLYLPNVALGEFDLNFVTQ